MIREYRIRLGKKTIGSNLIIGPPTNITINGNLVPGWASIVLPGKCYRFYLPLLNLAYDPTQFNYIYFGNLSTRQMQAPKGYYLIDGLVIDGKDIGIYGTGGVIPFDGPNITLYELDWNDPLTTDPIEWRELKLMMQRDSTYNGLFKTYTTDLTFEKDGYEFIRKAYAEEGLDAKIPVLIEEFCGSGWSDKFEGTIRISDCVFDLSKCTVKTKVEDYSSATMLKGAQDVIINIIDQTNYPLHVGYVNTAIVLKYFDDTGTYSYTGIKAHDLYSIIRRIITEATDNQMDFVSDFFGDFSDHGWALTRGYNFIVGYADPNNPFDPSTIPDLNFKKLFIELDKIFNLSMSFEKNNNIPYVRIEPKSYYETAAPAISLTKIDNLSYSFHKEGIIKTIRIGYDQRYNSPSDQSATSTEGWVEHYTSIDYNAEQNLDLVSSFIADSGLFLFELFNGSTGGEYGYGDRLFLTIYEGPTQARKYFNAMTGKWYYNDPITPHNNFLNRLPTLRAKRYQANKDGTIYNTPKPLVRLWEINVPLTPGQIDTLKNAGQSITFSGKGQAQALTGYITGLEYEFKTGMAKIQVLTE